MNFNHASNTRVLSFFTPPHTSFFCDFNVFISNAIPLSWARDARVYVS